MGRRNLKICDLAGTSERVAVGRKYPCTSPLWICLLWELPQSRACFMCNWAQILICCSHCICNPFGFYLMEILWSRVEKFIFKKCNNYAFHKVKAKRVANTVTATYLNLSPVAHELSSGTAPKRGKFTEDSCMNISFLRLPSRLLKNRQ